MGYTRYNYKPKKRNKRNNNSNFLIMSLVVILIAVVVGLFLGPIIFKGDGSGGNAEVNAKVDSEDKSNEKENDSKNKVENTEGTSEDKTNNESEAKVENIKGKEIFMIQCGYYGKKENAQSALKEIPSSYNKFIIEENKKFRVIAGIYLEPEANKISDELTKKGIANVKIKCNYNNNDKNDLVSYEILTGFMKIINNLENKDVKSIKTTEFKEWTKKLFESKKIDKENNELKLLREYIEKLPNELDRKGAGKSLEFIYKILIKHRV